MRKVTISFKNTTKDTKLWLEINKQEEKSQFIKDCIQYFLDNQYPGGANNEK